MMRAKLVVFVVLSACSLAPAGPALVWVEAEAFQEPGGWVHDAQFIDQMGSPYLLAHGWGTPVADATTNVTLPQAGRYRLWVRTKDWLPKHHPGRFQVVFGGQADAHVFGKSGPQLMIEKRK